MRRALTTAVIALAVTGMASPAHAGKPQPPTLEQLCPGYVIVPYNEIPDGAPVCDLFGAHLEFFGEGAGSYEGLYDDVYFGTLVVNGRYLVASRYGFDTTEVTYFGTGGGSTYTINRCVDGESQEVRVNRRTFLATVEQYEADRRFLVANYDPAKDRGDFTAISVINPDFDEDAGDSITCP